MTVTSKRHCNHCFRDHFFERDEDDRDECPRCGNDLAPISSQVSVTKAEIEAASVQDELAVLIEDALQDDAVTIWGRVDDATPGDAAKITDVAGRIAARLVDGIRPMIHLASTAQAFAVATKTYAAASDNAYATASDTPLGERSDLREATRHLHDAATALKYGCRLCGSQLVRLDEDRRCRDCAAPIHDPEAELDARCWDALTVFKENPAKFHEATRAILKERPKITMVEFVDRATRKTRRDS